MKALPWGPWIAAIAVGSLTAVQSRANGSLALILVSGLQAASVSFAVGLVLLTVVGLAVARIRKGMARLLHALGNGSMPWWYAVGGVFGALFIFSQSYSVGIIGVSLFAISLVAGQNSASLVIDAVGLGPQGKKPASALRVIAAVLGIIAVVVAVHGKFGDRLSVPAVVLCFVTGIGVAVQQAINGRSTQVSKEPLVAAWTNFALGGLIVTIALGVTVLTNVHEMRPLPAGPWWLYLGGIIGVAFLATTAWVVGKVGVLTVGLLATAGQLTGALILDLVVLDLVDGELIIGLVLALVAVFLTSRGSRQPRTPTRATTS